MSKNLWTYFKTTTQPKCPSTRESIKKLCEYHTIKYYTSIKISEVLIHATWVNVKEVRHERRHTVGFHLHKILKAALNSKICDIERK